METSKDPQAASCSLEYWMVHLHLNSVLSKPQTGAHRREPLPGLGSDTHLPSHPASAQACGISQAAVVWCLVNEARGSRSSFVKERYG